MDLKKVASGLEKIAAESAFGWLIDTNAEKAKAAHFLEKSLKDAAGDKAAEKKVRDALDLIRSCGSDKLQVYKYFNGLKNCSGSDTHEHLLGFQTYFGASHELLGRLESTQLYSQYVYFDSTGTRDEAVRVDLSLAEWREIADHLRGNIKDAAAEREAIKLAVAAFERIVGKKQHADTSGDVGGWKGNALLTHLARLNSCITNTERGCPASFEFEMKSGVKVYKPKEVHGRQQKCMHERDTLRQILFTLIRFYCKYHKMEDSGSCIKTEVSKHDNHTAVVIVEKATKKKWVVDSWFHDNGVVPEILGVDEWKKMSKP